MRIQDRTNMQIAFNRHSEKIELAGHAENEVERTALVKAADTLAAPWQTEEFAGDWQYLRDLRDQWREDPDRMRAETMTALAGRNRWTQVDEETDRRQSHMSYVQHFWDPREKEIEAWREMHDKAAFLTGTMALADSEEEIEAISARVGELYDQTTWPESWKEREAEVADDWQFWDDKSRLSSEYTSMIEHRPQDLATYAPFLSKEELASYTSAPALAAEREDEVHAEEQELEESL